MESIWNRCMKAGRDLWLSEATPAVLTRRKSQSWFPPAETMTDILISSSLPSAHYPVILPVDKF